MTDTTVSISNSFTIPKGSWILVTGANGYIASHITDQLLRLGYNIRGTVRDLNKHKWIEKRFNSQKNGKFELVQVEDAMRPGAFDDAIRGKILFPQEPPVQLLLIGFPSRTRGLSYSSRSHNFWRNSKRD